MRTAIILLFVIGWMVWAQPSSDACCKCDERRPSGQAGGVVCLNAQEMRRHVNHIEPLQPSGYGKKLNLAGIVVIEVRFDSNGTVACARAKSGHPLGVSAAMAAINKWTFRPIVTGSARTPGCGIITIKYRLRDKGSSTELQ
ncbi:MAG: hypothetical protein ABI693_12965 [Bryobacteraceae bacterium]